MDWTEILLRIGVAILVGTIIGVEREYKNRPAGMRTHVLVCLGACMIALLECCLLEDAKFLGGEGAISFTIGRMSAQVISGIGFLGAGTIFTTQKKIAGLTTAASLWNVGCLGLAVGYGYYWISLIGCAFVIGVLLLLARVVKVNAVKKVEVKFAHRLETLAFITQYFEEREIKVLDIDFHVESIDGHNVYTNNYTLHLPTKLSYTDVVSHLSEYANIESVRTTNT